MTTEARPKYSRRELLDSWRRGSERARHLGLDAGAIEDDPTALPDAELHKRLWALHRWVVAVKRTDWPVLYAEFRRAGGYEGMALREDDDLETASELMRLSLHGRQECEANMKGGLG